MLTTGRKSRIIRKRKRFWQQVQRLPPAIGKAIEEFWILHKDYIEYVLCIGSLPFLNSFALILMRIIPVAHVRLVIALLLTFLSLLNVYSCFKNKKEVPIMDKDTKNLPKGCEFTVRHLKKGFAFENVIFVNTWDPKNSALAMMWGFPPTTPLILYMAEQSQSKLDFSLHIFVAAGVVILLKCLMTQYEKKIIDVRNIPLEHDPYINASPLSTSDPTEYSVITSIYNNKTPMSTSYNPLSSPFQFQDLQPCAPILTNYSQLKSNRFKER